MMVVKSIEASVGVTCKKEKKGMIHERMREVKRRRKKHSREADKYVVEGAC